MCVVDSSCADEPGIHRYRPQSHPATATDTDSSGVQDFSHSRYDGEGPACHIIIKPTNIGRTSLLYKKGQIHPRDILREIPGNPRWIPAASGYSSLP